MTIVYFDSSAFVKLLVDEDGSALADELWDRCDTAISSRLAYPEVRAALAATARNRLLSTTQLKSAERAWEQFWSAVRAVELTADVAHKAGRLAREHRLGGADAVHLASALALGRAGIVFATWDRRLQTGVSAVGLALAPNPARPPATDNPV